MEQDISSAMDKFYTLVCDTPSTDAVQALARQAAAVPPSVAIEALSRLYVVAATQLKHIRHP